MLGYQEEELLSRPFLEFVHPQDVESTIQQIRKLDEGQPAVMFENRYFHKDGSIRWIQWNSVVVEGTGLIYAVARDVTQRQQDEESLRHYAAELEARNQELQETQERLIQAEKMESIGRLATGVAHEVKNPLAILQMAAEYLQEEIAADRPDLGSVTGEMMKAISRADQIICGLVNFSRQTQLNLEPIEFSVLAEEALLMLRHELRKHEVEVTVDIEEGFPRVVADRIKFEQVLVNLVSNSIDAMEGNDHPAISIQAKTAPWKKSAGPHSISGGLGPFEEGQVVICIEVRDNGPGVSPENLRNIFDPFFTTKPPGSGTGLGLAVVQKIIELHEGQIDFGNLKEGGCRVRIQLPKP